MISQAIKEYEDTDQNATEMGMKTMDNLLDSSVESVESPSLLFNADTHYDLVKKNQKDQIKTLKVPEEEKMYGQFPYPTFGDLAQ